MFGLPGENKMTPAEGMDFFGIRSICRVVMSGLPEPPFEADARELDRFQRVVWSIIGDGGSLRNNAGADLEPFIAIAKKHPNIVGCIMDDFMNEKRIGLFSPDDLARFKTTIQERVRRKIALWTVIYTQEISDRVQNHIRQCDVATLWTWWAHLLTDLEENYEKLRRIFPYKPILAGCYLWDYGNRRELPDELMRHQLDTYYRWLKAGKIDGVILCSNCCADLGLRSVEITKQWIAERGDERIG